MTITVKQLSGIFEDINTGEYKPINQLDSRTWECNGYWIEKSHYGGAYYVQHNNEYLTFCTFGDAVEFCRNAG